MLNSSGDSSDTSLKEKDSLWKKNLEKTGTSPE
jgi:hypothetical protein